MPNELYKIKVRGGKWDNILNGFKYKCPTVLLFSPIFFV